MLFYIGTALGGLIGYTQAGRRPIASTLIGALVGGLAGIAGSVAVVKSLQPKPPS